jgi:cytochrome c553
MPGRALFAFLLALLPALAPAAAAPFEDTMAQRTLACTSCHGREGRAGPDGYYPRIAGKPAGYLYNQLLHFRDGRRHYGLMAGLLEPLSNEFLFEVAQHFSKLDVPHPPPPPSSLPAAVLQRGRVLAQQGDPERRLPACASCHGAALTGTEPSVPGLLGLPRDYLNAQLGAWRTGQRRANAPDCMAEIARRLSADDLSAVTAWLAAEPVPAHAKAAPAPEPEAAQPARSARRKATRKAAPVAAAPPAPAMRCGSAPLPVAGTRP